MYDSFNSIGSADVQYNDTYDNDQVSIGCDNLGIYLDTVPSVVGSNINEDPMFAGTVSGDFRLLDGSPCIDAGDNDSTWNDQYLPAGKGTARNDLGNFGGPYLSGRIGLPEVSKAFSRPGTNYVRVGLKDPISGVQLVVARGSNIVPRFLPRDGSTAGACFGADTNVLAVASGSEYKDYSGADHEPYLYSIYPQLSDGRFLEPKNVRASRGAGLRNYLAGSDSELQQQSADDTKTFHDIGGITFYGDSFSVCLFAPAGGTYSYTLGSSNLPLVQTTDLPEDGLAQYILSSGSTSTPSNGVRATAAASPPPPDAPSPRDSIEINYTGSPDDDPVNFTEYCIVDFSGGHKDFPDDEWDDGAAVNEKCNGMSMERRGYSTVTFNADYTHLTSQADWFLAAAGGAWYYPQNVVAGGGSAPVATAYKLLQNEADILYFSGHGYREVYGRMGPTSFIYAPVQRADRVIHEASMEPLADVSAATMRWGAHYVNQGGYYGVRDIKLLILGGCFTTGVNDPYDLFDTSLKNLQPGADWDRRCNSDANRHFEYHTDIVGFYSTLSPGMRRGLVERFVTSAQLNHPQGVVYAWLQSVLGWMEWNRAERHTEHAEDAPIFNTPEEQSIRVFGKRFEYGCGFDGDGWAYMTPNFGINEQVGQYTAIPQRQQRTWFP